MPAIPHAKERAHRNHRRPTSCRGADFLTVLTLGCATTPERSKQAAAPLPREAIRKFYEKAKDPRQFWITVYPSANGPVFSGTHRLYEAQLAEVPFERGEPFPGPVVKFRGHGAEVYRGLVDTSAADNWTDFEGAAAMGATLLGGPGYSSEPSHVPDTLSGYLTVMDRIRFEGLYVENALFFARGVMHDLGPLARGVTKPELTAVLGMRFIEPFSFVRFDFKGASVAFASTRAFEPRPDVLIASVPIEKDAGGALAVRGTVNGKPETIILDTAGDYAVAMKDPEETELRHLSLGDLVLRHLPCTGLAEEGLGLEDYPRVGLDVLSRFVLVIDNTAGLVHFERPEE